MNIFIIDTNALISFITDRNPAQQKQIAEIFESSARLKCRVYCPQNVITEFVYVMEKVYSVYPTEIRAMVNDFLELPGIEIVHEIDYKILFTLWPDPINDFADAIVASICKAHKNAIMATFDKKLITALKKKGMPLHRFLKGH